jgi:hypothetical protein
MKRPRNRLHWRRRAKRVRGAACARLTPPAGLCGLCRELLAKCPATVLRAEGYRCTATETGSRS